MSTTEKTIKSILVRLEKLEREVFVRKKTGILKLKNNNYSGITGGVRLLISKNYFNKKRLFNEIKGELSKNGYHSSRQAVNQAMNELSKSSGPLVKIKEKGSNHYAIRK